MAVVVASAAYTASQPLPLALRESISTDSSLTSSGESPSRFTYTPTTSPESAKHSPHMFVGVESRNVTAREAPPSRTSTLDLPPPLVERSPVVLSPSRRHARTRTVSSISSTSSLLRTTLRLSTSASHTPISNSRRTSISSASPSCPQTPSNTISFPTESTPIEGLSGEPTTALSNSHLDSLAQFSPTPRASSTLSQFRVAPSSFNRDKLDKSATSRHARSSSASPSLRSYRNKGQPQIQNSIYTKSLSEQEGRSLTSPLAWFSSGGDKKIRARTQSLGVPPSISRAHAPDILISIDESETTINGLAVPSTSRNTLELNGDGNIVGTPRPPTFLVGQPGIDVEDRDYGGLNVKVDVEFAESPTSIEVPPTVEYFKYTDIKGKGREYPRGVNPDVVKHRRQASANCRPAISTIFESQTSSVEQHQRPPFSTHSSNSSTQMRRYNTMPSLGTTASPAPPQFQISGPTTGIPIPPQLKAIEKNSRLMRAKVCCVECGKVGPDFPRCPRCDEAWCSRECRVAAAVRETAELGDPAASTGKPKHVCKISK